MVNGLARPTAAALGAVDERTAHGDGGRGVTALCGARAALWHRALGWAHDPPIKLGRDCPDPEVGPGKIRKKVPDTFSV